MVAVNIKRKARSATKNLTYIALMLAFICVMAQIVIPLPFTPVQITLATLGVYITCAVFGFKGLVAVICYVLAGAIGLPVFAAFQGGFGVILGPTGGYIIGYILCGIPIAFLGAKGRIWLLLSLIFGFLLCSISGCLWYMYVADANLKNAVLLTIVPFIPGDAMKMILTLVFAPKFRKALRLK